MKIYMVGGAVRDGLLGLPVQDRDWVVVGATPQVLMQAGYLPVGKDFPVFLHPQTHEEVALARTERKTARGYHGFAFHADASVTLEEDLARRDLTINAIAQDDAGNLIDPYGGQKDLQAKILRHVTLAFAEDPVRILRVARFAARYVNFTIAPETMQLMRQMVSDGEVDALVAERVWQELARGLMEKQPSRMIEVLRECGALARILPEVEGLFAYDKEFVPGGLCFENGDLNDVMNAGAHMMCALDISASTQAALPVRYAVLLHLPGQGQCGLQGVKALDARVSRVEVVNARLRVPADCRELAVLAARELAGVHEAKGFDAVQVFALFRRSDAFRKPERFMALLGAAQCDAHAYPELKNRLYPQGRSLQLALQTVLAVDTKIVAQQAMKEGLKGEAVGEAIDAARLAQVRAVWDARIVNKQ